MSRFSTRILCLSVLATGGSLWADGTAQLRAQLLDAQGNPLAEATAVLESVERGERRTLRCDAKGWVVAGGLLPGAYLLQGQRIQLRAGEQMEIRIRSGEAQRVVAVVDSPLRTETHSVSVQTSFDAAELQRLPLSPHRYVEHAMLAPGVTPSGKPEPVVLGSMLDGNAFMVDGMPTNLGSTGRFGMNLGTEILESQTLTTGGHKAEVGFAPGGVFTLVTRSGTNTFQGALFGSSVWRGLNARPNAGETNNPEERPTDAREWGVSLGGPLVRNRLFFFAAFNRQQLALDYDNVQPPGGVAHRRSLLEDRSYRFAKLTWLAAEAHRLELAYFHDPVDQRSFDDPADPARKDEQLGDRRRGGESLLLKHVGLLGEGLTWENTLGFHRTRFVWSPGTPEAGPNRAQLDAPFRESFGRYPEDRSERFRNLSLRSELSWISGTHHVKAGFQGLRAEFTTEFRRPSGGEAFLDRAGGGAGPSTGDLAAIRSGLTALHGTDFGYGAGDSLVTPSPVSGHLVGGRASYLYQRTLAGLQTYGAPLRQTLAGVFIQDDWHPSLRWTLHLGGRVDWATVAGEDGRTLYRQVLGSPRLGISFDPKGDGRNRLFLYAGRIFSPPTPGALATAGATTGGPSLERQVWIPSEGGWRSWQRVGIQGVRNVAVAEDLAAARTDLWQAGAERMQDIPGLGTWVIEGVFTIKRVRDLIDQYNPAWGYLPEFAGAANASAGRRYVGNLPGLRRDYRGLDLSLHRTFGEGYRLQVSYSYGDLRGNSEVGNVASVTGRNTGFAQIPSLREDYRQGRYDGPLNESVKHAWKAFFTAPLFRGWEASGSLLYRSGFRYAPLVVASGENVLAPGAVRGERELPHVFSVDLGVARAFRVDKVLLRVGLEAFNLTNAQPMTGVNNVGLATQPGNHQQPRGWQLSARASF